MKKKIGILTFWNEINYGALLQLYSLYKFLKNKKYNVEIIRYFHFKHLFVNYLITIFSSFKIINNIKKIIIFKKFFKKINKSKLTFKLKENYDGIIIGSDEVWNLKHSINKNNMIFFGQNTKAKVKIASYAASFGSTNYKDYFFFKNQKLIKKNLIKFQKISVRDHNSKKILSKIGINSEIHVDPIFLLEKKIKKFNFNYFVIYGKISNQFEIKQIKKISQIYNLKIISIAYYNKWCDENLIECKIDDFLSYFKNCNLIATNMLHGEFFSIKFRKRFIRLKNHKKINKFNHIFNRYINFSNFYGLSYFDAKKIDKIINKKIEISKKYLIKEINGF